MDIDINVRIGQRLKKIREHLGFTKQEIFHRIGFNNYQTLSDIEDGKRALKVWELSKFSKIYNKDPMYFIQEEKPVEPVLNFAWREKDIKKNTETIESKIQFLHETYNLFEELTNEKKQHDIKPWNYNREELTSDKVIEEAENLVCELRLGKRPGAELLNTMENVLNLKIVYIDLEGCGSAVVSFSGEDFAIFINFDDAPWRRNFNLAHELFHLYSMNAFTLEKLNEYEKDSNSKVERLANEFASTLLLPEKLLKEIWAKIGPKENKSIIDFINSAIDCQVSTQTLLISMKKLNILNPKKVDEVLRSPKFEILNKQARLGKNDSAKLYSSRFIRLGIKALRDGKISKGKFCRTFYINHADFSNFISERGYSDELIYGEDIEFDNT